MRLLFLAGLCASALTFQTGCSSDAGAVPLAPTSLSAMQSPATVRPIPVSAVMAPQTVRPIPVSAMVSPQTVRPIPVSVTRAY